MEETDLSKLTPEQIEALIRWTQDPGTNSLAPSDADTESRVELECYVADLDLEKPSEAA
jgi:hypothetical protein